MLSLRRAPNLGTSWCPHRVCAQPDSGSIDIFFLASSPHFSHPHGICRYISTTLVVDAIVAGPLYSCKFTRTLIDGGRAINILYRDTLIKLGISESELEPSRTFFTV